MRDQPLLTPSQLFDRLTSNGSLRRVLDAARDEDFGREGDVTTRSIVEAGQPAEARLVVREAGIIAGVRTVPAVIEAFDADLSFHALVSDGDRVAAGAPAGTLAGDRVDLLGIERTVLNVIGRLSGIATLTGRFVDAVEGTGAVICATRKTAPGLRHLDKYAVACGGGDAHRLGLHDAALYKDNHLAGLPPDRLAPALSRAIERARQTADLRFVEVEVDTPEQLRRVLTIDEGLVDMILLDNMDPGGLRAAVALRDAQRPDILLEASGGVTLETVPAIAETGVDRISVGGLTHSAPGLDVAVDLE